MSRQINNHVSVSDDGSHLEIRVDTGVAAVLSTAEAVLLLTEITDWLAGNGWRRVAGGWERNVAMATDL